MFRFILKWMVISGVLTTAIGFSCRDKDGNSIDWYYMYKAPRINGSLVPLFKAGEAFFYLGKNTPTWTLSRDGVKSFNQPVYQTLKQIYSKHDPNSVVLIYNDQELNGPEKGHTKGVVAFTKNSGFWLIHSVPKFPSKSSFKWPDSASKNGQTFLCISFDTTELETIVTQLWYNNPKIVRSEISDYFKKKEIPHLNDIIDGKQRPTKSFTSREDLKSVQGSSFVSFAKSEDFNKDLYDEFVAPTLGVDLFVQSWQNGAGGKLPSTCDLPNKVMNIKETKLSKDAEFKTSKDHSKWAVSVTNGQWVCIGDINRVKSQFKRGGGAVCLQNNFVWKAFHATVIKYEPCSKLEPRLEHQDVGYHGAGDVLFWRPQDAD